MDLAVFYVTYVEPKLALTDTIWLFLVYTDLYLPLRGSLPPPTLHPYRSACGIGIANKNI